MARKKLEFKLDINADATSLNTFSTEGCFDLSFVENNNAPIDSCFEKIEQLNLIHTQYSLYPGSVINMSTTYNLILLGYISAIESYIREIIRKTIIIDKISRISCELEEINYGAAINYPKHLLPEVILEKASFASKKNIIDSFKKFLGLEGNQPDELINTLNEFEKICHLRHCIVHRFGKLGSKNAIQFGLDDHSGLIEKPLKLDINMVYELSIICSNTVLVVNKHLFNKILERTCSKTNCSWTWDLRKDKSKFEKYYNLYNSTRKPHVNATLNNSYSEMKKYFHSF